MGFLSIGVKRFTCDPSYYKRQQELFIDLYNHGYVSRQETYVGGTVENSVLANEQVINGRGWRSNAIWKEKKLSMVLILLNN